MFDKYNIKLYLGNTCVKKIVVITKFMYTKYNTKVRALYLRISSVNAVFRRLLLATHCIVWGNNASVRVTALNNTALSHSLMHCSALGSVSWGITLTHGSVDTNYKVPSRGRWYMC